MDSSSKINADVPIKTINDDELNRADFSIRVAESILNYDDKECLVLGLMGEWGSGKTSIRNMVFEHIESKNEEYILIKFNPWYFSNQDSLLFHFFDELTEGFNKKDVFKNICAKVSKLKDKLVSATTINVGVEGNGISLNLKELFNKKDYETFNSIKIDLMKLFDDFDYKIIISIDDIDRLTNDEIKQIFLLVKSLANFPNVIYILSFEDFVVKKALSSESYSGESYLEKIIQIPIFVPEVTQTKMNDLIMKRFYSIFSDNPEVIERYFDRGLKNILWKIFPFIKTIRDLNRYMNVLNFYKGSLVDELNVGDFLILLLLQIFEQEIYKEIKNRKYDLIGFYKLQQLKFDEQKEVVSNLFNDLYALSQTKLENELFSVLLYLFPIFVKINMPNQHFNGEDVNRWADNKKICAEKYFDKYFTLTLEENEVSDSFISELLEMEDVDAISKIFIDLDSRNQIKDTFNKLIPRIMEIPQDNCQAFIKSILDIGEVIDLTDDSFIISNSFYISGVLEGLIRNLNDRNVLYELLKSKLNDNDNLFTVIELVYEIGYDYGCYLNDNPKNENEICITKDQFIELKDMACNKIKELNETGRLVKDKNLAIYLTYWHIWGYEEEVGSVFDSNFENDDDFIEFLDHFRSNSLSGGMHRRNIDFDKIKKYYDLEKVVNKIKEIKSNEKTSEDYKIFCEKFCAEYKSFYRHAFMIDVDD